MRGPPPQGYGNYQNKGRRGGPGYPGGVRNFVGGKGFPGSPQKMAGAYTNVKKITLLFIFIYVCHEYV